MTTTGAAPGRPLRALALLLLAALAWFAVRLPGVEQRYLAAIAANGMAPLPSTRATVRHPVERGGPSPYRGTPALTLATATDTIRKSRRLRTIAAPAPFPKASAITATPNITSQPVSPVATPITPPTTAAESLRPGFALATQAYAALAARDARTAARLFGEALAAAGNPVPRYAIAWQREQRRLTRHWSGDAYTLRRDPGSGGAAASPVLGGGQSGGTLAWTIDPLARRPLAIIGRLYAAHAAGGGIDSTSAQAAVGLRWQVTPGVSVAAERLLPIGDNVASDWNLRLAGGGQRTIGRVTIDGYGEAGVRGNGDAYAGGQARAMAGIGRAGRLAFSAGPGAWGSIQRAQTNVGRLDIGAGITMATPVGLAVSADWRWRVAGHAAPGSGPAVTVSAAF